MSQVGDAPARVGRAARHLPVAREHSDGHTYRWDAAFDVEDEPYFIELQDPASARILLTADYGPSGVWPIVGDLYASDTSLQADGRTRVVGYTREVGQGGVAYFAPGHCHNPAIRAGRAVDAADKTPPTFHGSWESDAFIALLRNGIAWGVGA